MGLLDELLGLTEPSGESEETRRPSEDICPHCGGAGVVPDTNLDANAFMDPCVPCGGTGRVEV